MFDIIADLLSWFYTIWPSYGGAIILLTLLIMVILAPLTIRQTKSMLEMQRLQPEIKRLRAKYGDDREKLNQEMMALYQANGVNPLGGCLPILVQMPVLLVLYQIMRGLTRRVSTVGIRNGESVVVPMAGESDFPKRGFNPEYIDSDSDLYTALTEPGVNEMKSFGIDLAESAQGALGQGILTSLPYLLLVIGVGVSTWAQQRLVQNRASGAAMNPQQQAIMKFLPFMLPIFSFGFPAALVLYWFISNLFRVGQQVFITKQIYGKRDDSQDIVVPESQQQDDEDVDDSVSGKAKGSKPKADAGLHGSRSPVSGPKPKKKNTSPSKRTTEPTRERNPRTTSKRVTPKKTEKEAPPVVESGKKRRSFTERLEAAQQAQDEKRQNKKKK